MSLPVGLYADASVTTIELLHLRFNALGVLPQGMQEHVMIVLTHVNCLHAGWKSEFKDSMLFYYLLDCSDHGIQVTYCITIKCDFSLDVSFRGQLVNRANYALLKGIAGSMQSGI